MLSGFSVSDFVLMSNLSLQLLERFQEWQSLKPMLDNLLEECSYVTDLE